MKTASQLLVESKALIADPVTWTTGHIARDAAGTPIQDPFHPDACQFCMYGALGRVAGVGAYDGLSSIPACDELDSVHELRVAIQRVTRVVTQESRFRSIGDFNDNSTHQQVMNLLDKAIQTTRRKRGN